MKHCDLRFLGQIARLEAALTKYQDNLCLRGTLISKCNSYCESSAWKLWSEFSQVYVCQNNAKLFPFYQISMGFCSNFDWLLFNYESWTILVGFELYRGLLRKEENKIPGSRDPLIPQQRRRRTEQGVIWFVHTGHVNLTSCFFLRKFSIYLLTCN